MTDRQGIKQTNRQSQTNGQTESQLDRHIQPERRTDRQRIKKTYTENQTHGQRESDRQTEGE